MFICGRPLAIDHKDDNKKEFGNDNRIYTQLGHCSASRKSPLIELNEEMVNASRAMAVSVPKRSKSDGIIVL